MKKQNKLIGGIVESNKSKLHYFCYMVMSIYLLLFCLNLWNFKVLVDRFKIFLCLCRGLVGEVCDQLVFTGDRGFVVVLDEPILSITFEHSSCNVGLGLACIGRPLMSSFWIWLHMGLCIGISGSIDWVLIILFGIGQNMEIDRNNGLEVTEEHEGTRWIVVGLDCTWVYVLVLVGEYVGC